MEADVIAAAVDLEVQKRLLEVEFVLNSAIDFLADLKLTGEALKQGSQLLTDLEAARASLAGSAI